MMSSGSNEISVPSAKISFRAYFQGLNQLDNPKEQLLADHRPASLVDMSWLQVAVGEGLPPQGVLHNTSMVQVVVEEVKGRTPSVLVVELEQVGAERTLEAPVEEEAADTPAEEVRN